MILAVITFPFKAFKASFTNCKRWDFKFARSASHACLWVNLSSIPITYWLIRAFSFSGQMQNRLPISLGFSFSSYHNMRISHKFPRKFFASWVQGWAICTLLQMIGVHFTSSCVLNSSMYSLFSSAYCLRICTLSLISIRPFSWGHNKFYLELSWPNFSSNSNGFRVISCSCVLYIDRGL